MSRGRIFQSGVVAAFALKVFRLVRFPESVIGRQKAVRQAVQRKSKGKIQNAKVKLAYNWEERERIMDNSHLKDCWQLTTDY